MKFIKRAFQSPQLEYPFFFQFALYSFLFFYMFLVELLFWSSKPTFISSFPISVKINIAINCLAIILGFTLVISLFSYLVIRFSNKIFGNKKSQYVCLFFYSMPFILFSVVNYFYIDRWSYSVFGYSMVSRGTVTNLVLLFLFIMLGIFLYFFHIENLLKKIFKKRKFILAVVCILFFIGWVNLSRTWINIDKSSSIVSLTFDKKSEKLPNIVMLSYDMFTLTQTPFLGYKRNTTPILLKRKDEFYIFSRATAVASDSRGGNAALLTGRSPFVTHVFSDHDRLTGEDRFTHFMGLLMSMGYYTANYSEDNWSNPNKFNMKNGFREVDGVKVEQVDIKMQPKKSDAQEEKNTDILNTPFLNFFYSIEKVRQNFFVDFPILSMVLHDIYEDYMLNLAYTLRISDSLKERRLRALVLPLQVDEEVLIKEHKSKESKIKEPIVGKDYTHIKFINSLERLIQDKKMPFFIHCHNTVTHNPIYKERLTVRKFSKASDDGSNLYDDALLTMDGEVNEVIKLLKKYGQYDNTIFILTTDHEYGWAITGNSTALFLHFPGQTNNGRLINERVWLLDIVPTVTEYLGIPKASWMDGDSLLPLINGDKEAATYFENRFVHISNIARRGRQSMAVVKGNYSLFKNVEPGKESTEVRYLPPNGKNGRRLSPTEISSLQNKLKSFEHEFQRIYNSSKLYKYE